jgi:hypothetical protein
MPETSVKHKMILRENKNFKINKDLSRRKKRSVSKVSLKHILRLIKRRRISKKKMLDLPRNLRKLDYRDNI